MFIYQLIPNADYNWQANHVKQLTVAVAEKLWIHSQNSLRSYSLLDILINEVSMLHLLALAYQLTRHKP